MSSDAFDDAWAVLKGRSSAPPRRGSFRRKPPQTTDGAPAAPSNPDTQVNIDSGSLDAINEQARIARMEKLRHFEKLKRTDPEAYQKYLLEQQYAPGQPDDHLSSVADMMTEAKNYEEGGGY
jgi:hypothetical protein|tara:strand:- start:1377 stop:1742 length:366 start_codon:yes stop_codon:yes gene_type:complete